MKQKDFINKKYNIDIRLLLFCFFFLCPIYVSGDVVGSFVAVSESGLVTFLANPILPLLNPRNEINGFVWMREGFTLEDSSTTCTFEAAFPVSGTINLNGGNLVLQSSFVLTNPAVIETWGTVLGNSHRFDLSSSVTTLSFFSHQAVSPNIPTTDVLKDVHIATHNNLFLDGKVQIKGHCIVTGHGAELTLSDDVDLAIAPESTLELRNINIYNLSQSKIHCLDDSAKIVLDGVRVSQDADYTFTHGSLCFKNNVSFAHTYTFFYQSTQTSTIEKESMLSIGGGSQLSIGRASVNGVEPLYFTDRSSKLLFNNASFSVTSSGMQLINGTMLIHGSTVIDVNTTITSHGLYFGNGNSDNDLNIQVDGTGVIDFLHGPVIFDIVDINAIENLSTEAKINRQAGSIFVRHHDIKFSKGRFSKSPLATNIADPGAQAFVDNLQVEIATGGSVTLSGTSDSDISFLLDSGDAFILENGTYPLILKVLGVGNRVEGNGLITGPIMLLSPATELLLNFKDPITSNILLNGGSLTLNNDLNFTNQGLVASSGTISLQSQTLHISPGISTWPTPIYWDSTSGRVHIDGPLELSGTWTFSGVCTLDGDGNTLSLGNGANIVIDQGSRLTLKNIRLSGIGDYNIRCIDDEGAIVLNNITWLQDSDFTFTKGQLLFEDQVAFSGSYTFHYDSSQTSTIASDARLSFLNDMRFKVGRKPGVLREPFYLESKTSQLLLADSVYEITSGGMKLSQGIILLDREVFVNFNSTSTMNGLEIGNGVDGLKIEFVGGAVATLGSGHLVYNSPDVRTIVSGSKSSKLIRSSGNIIHLKQDLVLNKVGIETSLNTQVSAEPDKEIVYDDLLVIDQDYQYDIKATRYNAFTHLLDGNNFLFLSKGIQPAVALVQNTGNKIHGTGSMGQAVVLADNAAAVEIALEGLLLNTITLNDGKAIISNNLHLGQDGIFTGPGEIHLNNIACSLGGKDLSWNTPIFWNSSNGSINLNAKVSLSNTWTFSGQCTINGQGNVLSFDPGGLIVLARDARISFKNIRLEHSSGNDLAPHFDSNQILLDNVQWLQDGDFTFSMGSLEFNNFVDFGGSYTFRYESSQTSTVRSTTKWHFDDGMKLVIGRKVGSDREPLYMTDDTSELSLAHAFFCISEGGMRLSQGRLAFDRKVTVEFNSTSTLNGFELGDGVSTDVQIEFHPGASVTMKAGHFVYNVPVPTAVASRARSSRIIRESGNVLHLNESVVLSDIAIETHENTDLTTEAGKAFIYDHAVILDRNYKFDITGQRYNAFTHLLNNGGDIFISKGVQPAVVFAMGIGNKIHGTGSMGQLITLFDTNTVVTFNLEGNLLDNIALNNGKIVVDDDMRFSGGGTIVGPGTIDIKSTLYFGNKDTTLTGSLYWDGDDGIIALRSKLTLSHTWTFSGVCTIDGGGHCLSLGAGGQLVVERGSKLVLRNIRIDAVGHENIRCLDDAARIVVDGVRWDFVDSSSFARGGLEIIDLFDIRGSSTFYFETAQTCTINAFATWLFYEGSTLSYAPPTIDRDLIYFADSSSRLSLNNATLHSTTTGIQLQRGILKVKGSCYLASDGQSSFEGIWFGDGISSEQDIDIDIFPESNLALRSGYAVYKNVDA